MTESDKKCLRAYADCKMRAADAARKVFYANGTFDYHMAKIYKETGLNPKNFYDLAKLIEMIGD